MGEQVSPKSLFNIATTQLNTADFIFHPLLVKAKEKHQSPNTCHKILSQISQDWVSIITQG